jgi:hypothetical protein
LTGAGGFPRARLIPCLALLSILLGLQLVPLQAGEFKLPVWAPDDVSGFNTALRRRDFSVSVDTQPAAVKAIIPPSGNLVLLVVADAVNRVEEFDAARRTLIESMEDFNKRELVAVLRAQDGLRVILDPSANREATAKALLDIPVSGIPGLLDSVEQVTAIANEMIAKSKVRVAILYITDGSIYEYRGDYTSPVINPSDSGDLSRRFRDRLIQERISRLRVAVGLHKSRIRPGAGKRAPLHHLSGCLELVHLFRSGGDPDCLRPSTGTLQPNGN